VLIDFSEQIGQERIRDAAAGPGHEEIAEMIGASRETVPRVNGRAWKTDGCIQPAGDGRLASREQAQRVPGLRWAGHAQPWDPARAGAAPFALPERAARLVREAGLLAWPLRRCCLLLDPVTYDKADPGWSHASAVRGVHNAGGRVGAFLADLMLYSCGLGAYLLVLRWAAAVVRGAARLRAATEREIAGASAGDPDEHARFAWERWIGFGLLFLGWVGTDRPACSPCGWRCRWPRRHHRSAGGRSSACLARRRGRHPGAVHDARHRPQPVVRGGPGSRCSSDGDGAGARLAAQRGHGRRAP
jgi:hypothetical protein